MPRKNWIKEGIAGDAPLTLDKMIKEKNKHSVDMNKRGFTNNEYELNEGRDYKRRKLEPASANESSVFELPEIIEIIVSYLFGASKTILAISRLSKR